MRWRGRTAWRSSAGAVPGHRVAGAAGAVGAAGAAGAVGAAGAAGAVGPVSGTRGGAAHVVLAVGCLVAAMTVAGCGAATPAPLPEIFVAARDRRGNGSRGDPFGSLQEALGRTGPGTVVHVASGTYRGPFTTKAGGTAGNPVRLIGEGSVLVSGDREHTLTIRHDYVSVRGFVVAGGDQLLVIEHASHAEIVDNTFRDGGGECVRLKRANDNLLARNTVRNCGRLGFDLASGHKNGEGIYVGTTPDQTGGGGADSSSGNRLSGNTIASPAECVDIKEGASGNMIDANNCSGTLDPVSGGISVRGSGNTVTGNTVHDVAGAGIRLGGAGPQDGADNTVTGNRIADVGGVAVKAERDDQAAVCGNIVERAAGGASNTRLIDPIRAC